LISRDYYRRFALDLKFLPIISLFQLWILLLFLIYVTASGLNHLFDDGELQRILLTHRRSELQLNRRRRIRELIRLSDLADAHSVNGFRDPTSSAHHQLVDIVQRLAQ
jgi:hypothetical protein